MKRTKILALIFALTMAVVSMAGCGENENKTNDSESKTKQEEVTDASNKQEEKGKSDEEQVEDVVNAYFDEYKKLDGAAAAKYVAEDTDLYKSTVDLDKTVTEAMTGGMGDATAAFEMLGIDEAEFMEKMQALCLDVVGDMKFSIDKIDVSGDKATVNATIEAKIPDEADFSEEKMEEIMMKKLSEYSSETEALAEIDDIIIEVVAEVMANSGTKTIEGELGLEKIDDEWKIVSDNQTENLFGFKNAVAN